MWAARRIRVPTVAVYQTDVAGFADSYGLGFAARTAWRWTRLVHSGADRTLAPSSSAAAALTAHGVPRVHRWARGVDTAHFRPSRRDERLRARLALNGEILVGFVGRLAPEKKVMRLAVLQDMPGVRLVVVGDGPDRRQLAKQLPSAAFLGFKAGDELAQAYASLDVFVHTGPFETFCQTVQEALASGLPVIAPDAGGPRDLVAHGRPAWRAAAYLARGLRRVTWALCRGHRAARGRPTGGVMRIAQLANFYGPQSGGLRTALHHLGAGYAALGHEVVLVVPGPRRTDEVMASGVRRITLPAAKIPYTGGYRVIDPCRMRALLEGLRPDRLEVSDRLTRRGMGRWAAEHGVPSVVISHERLDRLLHQFLLPHRATHRVADWANRRMAASYDTVVCTTRFAREEFDRIGSRDVVQIPLGVDLATFAPCHRDSALRAELARGADAMLTHCGRLSPEKHIERSVDTIAELHESGQRVRLVIAGDGPRRAALQRRAAGLPVTFLGFVPGRGDVAKLLATSDVSLAPGPHETFGLAALEALASGTLVVVSRSSALREIVHPNCGAAVADHALAFADAVSRLLDAPEQSLRAAARARAEEFPWPVAVTGMLQALQASS